MKSLWEPSVTIGAILGSPFGDGCREFLKNELGVFPIYAGIGDGDTVLET